MVVYRFPSGMRYATLDERREFYEKEFMLKKVARWLRDYPGDAVFAVIIGRHTRIFPEKYREDASTTIIIDEYDRLKDVKAQILEFLPEGVYYDRNLYDLRGKVVGQELAFDLDPENITCPVHGTLTDKMRRRQGLSFCRIELRMVRRQAVELCEYLGKRFSDLRLVYSGRGFHIHVFDDSAYKLSRKQRTRIAKDVRNQGFKIDEWVTSGSMRLIRLPYSLHGLVSRKIMPLEKSELRNFDAVTDERVIPDFLRKQHA